MKIFKILFILLFVTSLSAQNVTSTFDQLFQKKYPSDGPGATVLVTKKGKVLYRNAFGKANLENNIVMHPDHVFEIGSITKQFTAVSILMLEEEGKLNVQDKLSKYLPNYPNGDQITIHQLLNHTSGIKSYTAMEGLNAFGKIDKSPIEIIDYFKDEPVDFQPGEQWEYNNSGYIVLGYIIEKVTGKTYEDFIQQRIFDVLGMKNSYYGDKARIIKNRASGYQPTAQGFRNAMQISMTIPYAAGSLMSCVDDMFLWHKAIIDNTLISAKSKAKAHTNTFLNNGKPTNYGYGWQINELNGKQSIEHGGGIFGFVTQGVYVPDEDIYVIVLTNANGNSPQDITLKLASMVMDTPMFTNTTSVNLSQKQLQKWTGTYEFENDVLRFVTLEGDQLYSQREGSEKISISPLDDHTFIFEDSFTTYIFSKENGKKKAVFKNRIDEEVGVESTKKATADKEGISLDPNAIKDYIGTYKLNPNFSIEITTAGNQIFAEATGQSKIEIFGEDTDAFFLKVVPAKLIFTRDASKNVTHVTLYQGGQEMKGIKVN
ncbi:serine hydrolase [uncultured Dokdonia sp.]|uniref:serine hydrolase n=1 Tax=uncultured Dokdonia sp. TaxID=575653 RepID=UPI002612B9AD|nr:serine hydrolase [uncultured Dokdonia sp.]